MESQELLQAIGKMMDQKLEPIQRDISGLKEDVSGLKQDVSGLKEDVSGLKEGQLKINIKLENDIHQKLSALFDGHKLNTEKIDHISETVDDIDATMTAVNIVTRANVKEINKLKAKIGENPIAGY